MGVGIAQASICVLVHPQHAKQTRFALAQPLQGTRECSAPAAWSHRTFLYAACSKGVEARLSTPEPKMHWGYRLLLLQGYCLVAAAYFRQLVLPRRPGLSRLLAALPVVACNVLAPFIFDRYTEVILSGFTVSRLPDARPHRPCSALLIPALCRALHCFGCPASRCDQTVGLQLQGRCGTTLYTAHRPWC